MTQNHDLGAMVGWAGKSHGPCCIPFPESRPRDMLGAPSPRTPTHQNWPCGLNPGFPEHGLAEGIGRGSCQGCGRQAGVRRQPLQLPQQVPRHWEGAVTQAGPGGEPALQTGTTQHPLHPLDEGPLPHWSWSLLVCTCQPKLPSSCPGPCTLVHDLQFSSSPTKPPLARSFPGDRPRGKMLQPQPPVLSARMLSWPRTDSLEFLRDPLPLYRH